MPKLKWSKVKEFEFIKLDTEWELDLLTYINTATILNSVPKAIKRIVAWLISTKKYKIAWTKIIKIS
jgi:hypothetical protein